MSHLGERVSALIDGELSHNERERALAHLTFCADCRAEVDALRALKTRLRSMDPPAMPADLTMSLLRMAEPGGPLPPRMRPFPDHPAFGRLPAMHAAGPMDNRPRRRDDGRSGPGRPGRARRAGYVAVGMASAAVALGTMLMAGGSSATPSSQTPGQMFVHPAPNKAPVVSVSPTPSQSVTRGLSR